VLVTDRVLSLLVVEDHAEVRAALRDWLLGAAPGAFTLREARNLEEALACALRAPPDVVLINLELPGPNGIEATRALRRRHPQCAVILMSVNDSDALRTAAIEAGALAFLSKRELPHALLPLLARLPS
jgi:DNA-binding NarL/FixJ family response regulator